MKYKDSCNFRFHFHCQSIQYKIPAGGNFINFKCADAQ